MGKRLCFFPKNSKRCMKKTAVSLPSPLPQPRTSSSPQQQVAEGNGTGKGTSCVAGSVGKGKKKAAGARLWMRMDMHGNSEVVEWDKAAIIKCVGIPARDLRILGSVFSQSSNILARERAMVVNFKFIRAIVTAEEVLILDPLSQEVVPFVDRLRQQLPHKSSVKFQGAGHEDRQDNKIHVSNGRQWSSAPAMDEDPQDELPFEFQVLEIALEMICTYLDSSVADLEVDAYPLLEELARNVNTKNLEHVRSLKSNLTRMLASVQKVRDEIEHLLDDYEDMANLYLTRKRIQNQQFEAFSGVATSNSIITTASRVHRTASLFTGSIVDDNVVDLEMLLEAYFVQLNGTRNKILSVREYIDDTEEYVNIQLNSQRNELIQIQLILSTASISMSIEMAICGFLSMNIPCSVYNVFGIFGYSVAGIVGLGLLVFLLVLATARWKRLLSS